MRRPLPMLPWGNVDMESSSYRTEARYLRLWTRLAVVFVVVVGLFALLQAPEASRSYEVVLSHAGWTVLVLFLVSLTNVAVTRFQVLPAIARREDASPDRIITVGYMLALTPVVYGLTSAVLSAEGWVSVPFSLLSLFAVVDLRLHFGGEYERPCGRS
jgi:hypothetical protein